MTYTAWLTTDATALDTDYCDVVVLASDEDGTSTGSPIWHALTTVRHDRDDDRAGDEAAEQAKALLEAAGWTARGAWEGVPTGAIITVEQS